MKDFAHIAVPLHDLLNKSEFVWTPQCDSAFKQLKVLFSDFETPGYTGMPHCVL